MAKPDTYMQIKSWLQQPWLQQPLNGFLVLNMLKSCEILQILLEE